MAGGGTTPSGELPTPPPLLDWVWVPIQTTSGTVDNVGRNSGHEFMSFPSVVRGELLSRICRLLDGESRRGDTTRVSTSLLGMVVAIGKVRYWIVYAILDNRGVGLLCCTSLQRSLETHHVSEAIRRSNAGA